MDAQFPDAFQKTPLHYAALLGDASIVEFLIESGAEPNAEDMALNTPLHEVAANGEPAAVEALLSAGKLKSKVHNFTF